MIRQNRGRAELSVTLDWQQACTVSGAVLEWLSSIESDIEDHRVPALHMELASLTFDFYRHGGGQGSRMICTAETERGLSRQVILDRSKASLLGRVLSTWVMMRQISRTSNLLGRGATYSLTS